LQIANRQSQIPLPNYLSKKGILQFDKSCK
jgi:hypothetical protein